MNTRSVPGLPGKLFAAVQVFYGAFVALGSCGELVIAIVPEILPPEVVAEYAKLHASPSLRGWVLVQNLATLPLGLGLAIAGVDLWRARPRALPRTRILARTMLAVCLLSQLALALLLYPDLLGGRLAIDDGDEMLVMMIAGGVGIAAWPAIATWLTRREL